MMLKGIVTRGDAEVSLEYGADGIGARTQGDRMEHSLRSAVECTPGGAAGGRGTP